MNAMAEKRMFSSLILDNDEFMDMPVESQMLYIRLNMAADDRGFCDNPKMVMKLCGACNDSIKLLLTKKFILQSKCRQSVVVVKHWWTNNNVRKERFKETKYMDVLDELYYDSNKNYSQNPNDGHIPCIINGKPIWPPDIPELMSSAVPELPPMGTQLAPNGYPTGVQPGDQWVPQNRIDKNRLDKGSIGESKRDAFDQFWDEFPKKSGDIRQAYQEYLLAIEDAKPEELLEALRKQVEAADEDDLKYFHGAAVWLRNREWKKPVTASKKNPVRKFEPTVFEDI